jgi:deoxyribonuclease-4
MTGQLGVHIDPPLAAIPEQLAAMGLSVFQTTLRDPRRLSKEGVPDEEDRQAFLAASRRLGLAWGIAHASMLTSLGSPDPRIRNGSAGALVADASLAAGLGLSGVCFHVGYQKGHASREDALAAVTRKLAEVLGRLGPGARVLLENGCEGTELGQTIEELAIVVDGLKAGPEQLGVVLDTCHLHVAGFDLAAPDAECRLAESVETAGLAPYLTALHLNDARYPCGSKRDRHAPPGQGTIGEGLRRIVRQELFRDLPSILEMGVEEALQGIRYLTLSE